MPGDPPVPVRVHRPRRRGTACPPSSPFTEAATSSAPTTWTARCSTAGVPLSAWSASPSSTASRPRRPTRARSRTATRRCAGPTTTPSELGIDKDRIGVYGLSAGGGLAAALALLARDRGEVPLAFAAPRLPDARRPPGRRPPSGRTGSTCGASSRTSSAGGPISATCYGSDEVPPYAAAARATDLAGLPPTCVVVGSIDGFRDEDIDYAQRLNQAGVPCELHVIAGLPHAYLLVPGAAAVQLAMHCMDDWLARQLAQLHAG